MSHQAQTWALKQKTGSPARKAVLMNLADRADEAWSCFPSQKRIAADTELGERTVRRAIEDLIEAGLMRKERRRNEDGTWSSDRFYLAGGDPATSGQSDHRPERPEATAAAGTTGQSGRGEPSGSSSNHQPPSPSERGGAREARSPAIPPKKDRRKPETPLPPDFQLSEGARKWTEQRHPSLPIDEEVEKFKARAERDDARYRNWEAAWRTWCGNWATWQRQRGGRPGGNRFSNQQYADGSAQREWTDFQNGAEL